MKNKKTNSADPMKKWITEAGTDTPGDEFHFSVLKKIESLPKTTLVYQPIISPMGWKLILGFILSIFAWSIFLTPDQPEASSLFGKLPLIKLPSLSNYLIDISFPILDISPQFLIGIGVFFILGFIMIIETIRNKQVGI